MMKKMVFILIPFVCIACSQQNTTIVKTQKKVEQQNYSIYYKGESSHWNATLDMEFEGKKETDFIELTYKGKDVNSLKEVNYSFNLPNDNLVEKNKTINPNGVIDIKKIVNNAKVPKDNLVVNSTVEWDGKKETFQIKLNNS